MLTDLAFALGFFAAFGSLNEFDCEENWQGWGQTVGKRYLDCWRTVEAFCFISGFCWLVATVLAWPGFSDKYVKRNDKSTRPDSMAS